MDKNSLKQYIEFYDANRSLIDSNSAPAINALRTEARQALEDAVLPRKGSEGYERTSLDAMLAPDFGINATRLQWTVDAGASFRCDVPAVSTAMAVVMNDSFIPTRSLADRLPQGVRFMSLRAAAAEMPQLVAPCLQLPGHTPMDRLNELLLQDGVLVYIPAGTHLTKPLQLVNIFSAPIDLMAIRRVLVIVGEGASGQMLVCDHTQDHQHRYMSLQAITIKLEQGARFDFYDLEEASPLTSRYSSLYASLEQESRLTVNGSTLSGGLTRNDYTVDLNGERSEARLAGMVIAGGSQVTDNSSLVRHHGRHTHSDQLFKYVLDGEASGAFEGLIVVDEEAKFTEAYQSNRNILASPQARMHTRPQLEIYCDDVKCSHGAATGQLDARALFYMRTRGIPEQQARNMLQQAFMADVIDTVEMDGLRDRLRHLVDRRFSGLAATCADCGAASAPSVN